MRKVVEVLGSERMTLLQSPPGPLSAEDGTYHLDVLYFSSILEVRINKYVVNRFASSQITCGLLGGRPESPIPPVVSGTALAVLIG